MTGAALELFARRIGHPSPAAAMRDLCGQLRVEAGELEPAIGFRRMLKLLRAYTTTRASADDVDARLRLIGGRYEIELVDQYWRRRRFTVAHEIGHMLVLDTLADTASALRSLREAAVMGDLERLCNTAAAELLMPGPLLRQDLLGLPFDGEALRWLYERYVVSWGALSIRLTELWPGARISFWSRGTRAGDPPTRARAAATYGGHGHEWLPPGISERRMSSPLISEALTTGQASDPDLMVSLGPRSIQAAAHATRMPDAAPGEVALLLLPATGDDCWERLGAREQLALPLADSRSEQAFSYAGAGLSE